MPRPLTLKNIDQESRIFNRRVIVAVMAIVILFTLLAFRMADLQLVQHEHFTTRSKENRVKIVPLPPPRGMIFSRDGKLLAENIPTYRLEVIPEQVDDIDRMILLVNSMIGLNSDEITRFKEQVKRKRKFEKVPLKYDLKEDQIARISVNRHRLPGVNIVTDLIRHYPYGIDFAHIVGYVGRINQEDERIIDKSNYVDTLHIGKTGIEKAYEPTLHGKVGYQQVEINAQGRILKVLKRESPTPGKDIYLTIDTRLQKVAAEALGERRGAVVAIEPATGAILAQVSYPSFDPNWFVNGISSARYQKLNDSELRPLFNRAIQGQYPPGSTLKPFMSMAARYYDVRTPHEHTWCPGWFSLENGQHRYRCWNKGGHGGVDIPRSIIESCDVYYYELAYDLGIDRMHEYLGRYGFGRVTGVDTFGEATGLLPSRDWKIKAKDVGWYPGETLITGIGQGYMLATPVQLASATATLAMRGQHVTPRIVGQIADPVTQLATDRLSDLPKPVVQATEEDWDLIIQAMRDVVLGQRGTARKVGYGAFYEFAGKTGTSQVYGMKQGNEDERVVPEDVPEHLRDHALFIAFAPVHNPSIAIAVVVEHGGSGGRIAAPVARQILDHYMQTH